MLNCVTTICILYVPASCLSGTLRLHTCVPKQPSPQSAHPTQSTIDGKIAIINTSCDTNNKLLMHLQFLYLGIQLVFLVSQRGKGWLLDFQLSLHNQPRIMEHPSLNPRPSDCLVQADCVLALIVHSYVPASCSSGTLQQHTCAPKQPSPRSPCPSWGLQRWG